MDGLDFMQPARQQAYAEIMCSGYGVPRRKGWQEARQHNGDSRRMFTAVQGGVRAGTRQRRRWVECGWCGSNLRRTVRVKKTVLLRGGVVDGKQKWFHKSWFSHTCLTCAQAAKSQGWK